MLRVLFFFSCLPFFFSSEIIEMTGQQSSACDIWSVGCLAPSTRVWLSDGREVRAEQLQPHHVLLDDQGDPVHIVPNTLSGTIDFPAPRRAGWYAAPGAGPDAPRTLCPGWLPLRRIDPRAPGFDAQVFSSNHQLTVARKDGSLADLEVQHVERDWAEQQLQVGELQLVRRAEPIHFAEESDAFLRTALALAVQDANVSVAPTVEHATWALGLWLSGEPRAFVSSEASELAIRAAPWTGANGLLTLLLTRLQVSAAPMEQFTLSAPSPLLLSLQRLPVSLRLALISGLLDGAGEVNTLGELSFVTPHAALAEWVCTLLRQTGFSVARPAVVADQSSLWQLAPISASPQLAQGLSCVSSSSSTFFATISKQFPSIPSSTAASSSSLSPFSITPVDAITGAPSDVEAATKRGPVVCFQVSNISQRFLLADASLTHNCTCVELLTGKPPYFDLQQMPALFRIVQDEHPPLPDNISPALEDFLLQCFQKDPNRRIDAHGLLKHPWLKKSVEAIEAEQMKLAKMMSPAAGVVAMGKTTASAIAVAVAAAGAPTKKKPADDSDGSEWDEEDDPTARVKVKLPTATTKTSAVAGSKKVGAAKPTTIASGSDNESDWDAESDEIPAAGGKGHHKGAPSSGAFLVADGRKPSGKGAAGKKAAKRAADDEEDELTIKVRAPVEEEGDPFGDFSDEDAEPEDDKEEVVGVSAMKTIRPTPSPAQPLGGGGAKAGATGAGVKSPAGGSAAGVGSGSFSLGGGAGAGGGSVVGAAAGLSHTAPTARKLEAFVEDDEDEEAGFNDLIGDDDADLELPTVAAAPGTALAAPAAAAAGKAAAKDEDTVEKKDDDEDDPFDDITFEEQGPCCTYTSAHMLPPPSLALSCWRWLALFSMMIPNI
jgi:hypothetical protein